MGPRPELTRTPRGLRYAYPPPAYCTHRRRRAACPQGATHCTYGARAPASGVHRVPWLSPPHTHVLTGAPRGYHPPQVLRVERHAAGFGQQTHFRIERASPRPHPDASRGGGGAEVVWLRARATGGYVNYRGENFVRGHGNHRKARSP